MCNKLILRAITLLSNEARDSTIVANITMYFTVLISILATLVLLYILLCMCHCLGPFRQLTSYCYSFLDQLFQRICPQNPEIEFEQEMDGQPQNNGQIRSDLYQTVPNRNW